MPLPNAWVLTRIARNWLRELIKDYPYPGLPGIFGSETMIFFMQLHLPQILPGAPFSMNLQLFLRELFISCCCSSGALKK